jgi:hypothetical protein
MPNSFVRSLEITLVEGAIFFKVNCWRGRCADGELGDTTSTSFYTSSCLYPITPRVASKSDVWLILERDGVGQGERSQKNFLCPGSEDAVDQRGTSQGRWRR